jgi:hypothetical protein
VWPQDEHGFLDLIGLLGQPQPDTKIYCCGPKPLLNAVEQRCTTWPRGSLHVERFVAKPLTEPRTARCVRGPPRPERTYPDRPTGHVHARRDRGNGIGVLSSCRESTCGTCETPVLDGISDHRGSVLDEEAREAGLHDDLRLPRRLVLDIYPIRIWTRVNVQYRTFGRAGWQVSEIAFGGWQLGGDWGAVDDTESVKTLHHAYERGINFVDTAELYGCGHSEEVIGEPCANRPRTARRSRRAVLSLRMVVTRPPEVVLRSSARTRAPWRTLVPLGGSLLGADSTSPEQGEADGAPPPVGTVKR